MILWYVYQQTVLDKTGVALMQKRCIIKDADHQILCKSLSYGNFNSPLSYTFDKWKFVLYVTAGYVGEKKKKVKQCDRAGRNSIKSGQGENREIISQCDEVIREEEAWYTHGCECAVS